MVPSKTSITATLGLLVNLSQTWWVFSRPGSPFILCTCFGLSSSISHIGKFTSALNHSIYAPSTPPLSRCSMLHLPYSQPHYVSIFLTPIRPLHLTSLQLWPECFILQIRDLAAFLTKLIPVLLLELSRTPNSAAYLQCPKLYNIIRVFSVLLVPELLVKALHKIRIKNYSQTSLVAPCYNISIHITVHS